PAHSHQLDERRRLRAGQVARHLRPGERVRGAGPSVWTGGPPRGLWTVPETHLLTDVAPEDPVPDPRPKLGRDRAPDLEAQGGTAARGIHDLRPRRVASEERAGRARRHARRAPPAAVGLEGRVGLELQLEEQRADEEVGAAPRMDEHGVAAEPTEPRPPGELPLQHRP